MGLSSSRLYKVIFVIKLSFEAKRLNAISVLRIRLAQVSLLPIPETFTRRNRNNDDGAFLFSKF